MARTIAVALLAAVAAAPAPARAAQTPGFAGGISPLKVERGTSEPHCAGWGKDYLKDLGFAFKQVLDASGYGVVPTDPAAAKCKAPKCVVTDLRYFHRPHPLLQGSPAQTFGPGRPLNPGTTALIVADSNLFCAVHDTTQLACILAHEVAHLDLKHPSRKTGGCIQKAFRSWVKSKPEEYFADKEVDSPAGRKRVVDDFHKERTSQTEACQKPDEDAADAKGTEYIVKTGFDPKACVKVWSRMQDYMWVYDAVYRPSHSPPRVRAQKIRAKIRELLGPEGG